MTEEILWERFTETGSVGDYLRYILQKADENDNS